MTIARITANRSPADIIACEANTQVRDVVKLLATKRIGAVPILENGQVVGIFSERDVIYRLADEGEVCMTRPVSQVMTAPAISVEETTTIDDALSLMTKRRIRHLPVLDNGALKAFISIGDLVKTKMDEVEHEAEAMRSYIQTA
ncbi:CBS domain-containing protein [Altererythrobacter lutimaris]|uniref:CBS domain-containing protein n=1 Tax=Altererythrobacter lutimaris TaxID=2743979 RepID=A0A850HE87_9SPHN|nr:CBS domain-containing protein [Altererythrobacter lutimaris]NVE95386.1 CBS domain-containing protein [Altererythrobacter lutimaris]